jgi:pimeloyl-ACP methyl ester carboxylesterase
VNTHLVADRWGEGPPVVLLHGQPGSAADWQWVVPKLASSYSLLVPDRPGYGRTGGPAQGFHANARSVVGLLDRRAIDRAVVVGHSWAGGVAIALAETFPERVAGLVLVSSVGPGERMGWDDRLLATPVLGETIAMLTIGLPGRLLGNERVQRVADRRLHGQALDAVRAIAGLTGGGAGTRVWRSFVVEQRAMLEELEGLGLGLTAIAAPTEILNGKADRIVPASVGELLERSIAGAQRTLIPDVGHLVPHDRPSAVAEAVRRVWDRAYTDR